MSAVLETSTGGRRWDSTQKSPYFNVVDDKGQVAQVRDESTANALARSLNVICNLSNPWLHDGYRPVAPV